MLGKQKLMKDSDGLLQNSQDSAMAERSQAPILVMMAPLLMRFRD